MLKWMLWIIGAAVIIIGITGFFFMQGPDLTRYEYLKEPQIAEKPDQTMLVVTAAGDPNLIGPKAFGTLYSVYYKLENNQKIWPIAPRARWPKPLGTPKADWIGLYALPVSAEAKLPKELKIEPGLTAEIQTWHWGYAAEILHIGSYGSEAPTVQKLMGLVKKNGYKLTGVHEEEYLRGPGMFGPGDPNKYYTIIRYGVSK